MNKLILKSLVAAAMLSGVSAVAAPTSASELMASKLPGMRTVDASWTQVPASVKAATQNRLRKASIDPSIALPTSTAMSFLEGPDGSIWYSTIKYDVETIELEGGYATEDLIRGFEITVYDNLGKLVGTVKDKLTLGEGEARIASVQPDITVTKKFFNTDDKYELIVSRFINPYGGGAFAKSEVYTIGGATDEDGNSQSIMSIPGYIVDARNYATNAYSESFLITFIEEVEPADDVNFDDINDFLDAYLLRMTTYKKAGWNGGASVAWTVDVQQNHIAGDTMNAPFFISKPDADGCPAFTVSYYDKAYFVYDENWEQQANEDNSLIIDTYKMTSATATGASIAHHTVIPCDAPKAGYLAKYYGIGTFGYYDDINYTDYSTDGSPAFIVTVQDQTPDDLDTLTPSFYVYDVNGNRIITLEEECDNYFTVSNLKGANAQGVFVEYDGLHYTFVIKDIITGETVVELPQTLDGYDLTTAFDRVTKDGKTYYVSRTLNHYEDADENTFEVVAWINADGTLSHVDEINIGNEVANAMVNVAAYALNPYLFDTDADVEYMIKVQRYIGDSTATDGEYIIADTKGTVFKAVPDASLGIVSIFDIVEDAENPVLYIMWYGAGGYTQQMFELPMTRFAGGDGSEANPYLIATIGDLQQIKTAPAANYCISADIEAMGFDFCPIASFSGKLDGGNHAISNLSLAKESGYVALFQSTQQGAEIKDITFITPSIELNKSNSYGALIASMAMGLKVDNVHVYDMQVSGDTYSDEFGSLVAQLSNSGTVTRCYVANSTINLPNASVGGMVHNLRTASSVKASAFSGRINACSPVGGIVAEGGTDFVVADCHVDADITGEHTVGGIVGDATRGTVTRNFFEGNLGATKPSWHSIAMGGVIGRLAVPVGYDNAGNAVAWDELPKIVTSNVVDIHTMSIPATDEPAYTGQHDTAHRIVGHSSVNDTPEIEDYDEDWNPIYGKLCKEEPGLANNYALDTMSPVQPAIEAAHHTTEGATLAADELDNEFLVGIGYAHGNSVESPWSELALSNPYLHFEQKIYVDSPVIAAKVGSTFVVAVNILTRNEIDVESLMDDFTFSCDESRVELTDMALEGKTLNLTFNCIAAGTSDITVSMLGSQVKVKVTGEAGVGNIVADTVSPVTFDGRQVIADGAAIAIYSTAGVQVASGYDAIDTSMLAAGVYVAVAKSHDGVSTLKIAIR